MKKLNLIVVLPLMVATISCGDTSEEITEESENSATNNTEEIDQIVTSELEPAIVEDLENEAFATKMNEVKGILIDVRTSEEFNNGHIEGALNLDYNSGEFESYVDSLDVTKPVFVYCQAGGRSGKARDILKDRDFLEVYNLKNGYGNWDK